MFDKKLTLILVVLIALLILVTAYVSYEIGRSQGHREAIEYQEELPSTEKSYIKYHYF